MPRYTNIFLNSSGFNNQKIMFIGIMMGCTYLPSVLIIGLYFEKKRGIATGITMAGSGMLIL